MNQYQPFRFAFPKYCVGVIIRLCFFFWAHPNFWPLEYKLEDPYCSQSQKMELNKQINVHFLPHTLPFRSHSPPRSWSHTSHSRCPTHDSVSSSWIRSISFLLLNLPDLDINYPLSSPQLSDSRKPSVFRLSNSLARLVFLAQCPLTFSLPSSCHR